MPKSSPFSAGLAVMLGLAFTSMASAQTSFSWGKDINTTPLPRWSPSNPNPARHFSAWRPQRWLKRGRYFYFTAMNGKSGMELFRSDGKTVNLVKDINPGRAYSYVTDLVLVGKRIFFLASASTTEIWVTDGTTAGTKRFSSANISTRGPEYITATGGKVSAELFQAACGYTMW